MTGLFVLRQLLPDETLVAIVEKLPLLYRVNADVEVDALDVDRQLSEAIELALDASGRPLRVLVGDAPRLSTLFAHRSM